MSPTSVHDKIHIDEEQMRRMSVNNPNITAIAQDAAKAAESEQHQSLWEALKLYRKAAGWSVLLSTAIIMEGFDLVLITNLFAVPAFKQRFGVRLPSGEYDLSAAWQSGLANGALCGEIIGLMLNGWLADHFGYRKTMIGALFLTTGFIFIVFFVQNIIQLLCGLILMGIPWQGVFQTVTTTYASEVTPVALRPYLTTYVNLCWVIGQFLASAVLKAVAEREDQWAYRIPYALQWLWPVPLIIGVFLAPESPWWLVRKGKLEDAKRVLLRLTSRNQPTFNADETIAMMVHTNEMERAITEGTNYLNCFRKTDLRRTEIASNTWMVQIFCGASFMGFSTYFYEQAGLAMEHAFTMSMVQYALGAIGVFASWGLMGTFGRRTLYLGGLTVMVCLLLVIGFCGLAAPDNKVAQWTIGSMLLIFTFVYDATVGPVCYSLVAEIPSTRLRQKTVVLARNWYNLGGIVSNVLTPRMLNPEAWNWGAKSGFFFAGTCFLCLVWAWFRLPEPKGRTYGELDALFEQKVPARQFISTTVDPYMTGHRQANQSHGKRGADGAEISVHQVEI